MPKLCVGTITIAQIEQKTSPVVVINPVSPSPPAETFYIITDNNEPIITDNDDYLIYGT
jgi:hypothetical protein